MRCRRCSHELSSGADRCLRCFALNPQNVAGPLFAGLDSDPPREVRVRFDDDPAPAESFSPPEKTPLPPKPRKPAAPPVPELPFVEIAKKTPATPLELTPTPPPAAEPSRRRLRPGTVLLAWAIDFMAVGVLTALHAGLAVAVLGPGRLAPGRAGSADYWLDLFRGGGLSLLWVLLAATLALAYYALAALLLGQSAGLAAVSRLRAERPTP